MAAPIGKAYPPVDYAVGREKVREFAAAVGEEDPLHHDPAAARAAGFRDVVAPPMFCVVYALPALGAALLDPAVGIDFARLIHGNQEFRWGPLVVAGDEVRTTVELADVDERGPLGFFVFRSVSTNGEGETVCEGLWTNVVRGA